MNKLPDASFFGNCVFTVLGNIVHLEILKALDKTWHGSSKISADGKFLVDIGVPAHTSMVYLDFKPDGLKAPEVLETIVEW